MNTNLGKMKKKTNKTLNQTNENFGFKADNRNTK
ncbi:MAG: hypothetical protein QG641_2564 [Candidatus Poribacteria bacterium]|nr:hypothetical protein [Candidatus Poribacteria bacterium]